MSNRYLPPVVLGRLKNRKKLEGVLTLIDGLCIELKTNCRPIYLCNHMSSGAAETSLRNIIAGSASFAALERLALTRGKPLTAAQLKYAGRAIDVMGISGFTYVAKCIAGAADSYGVSVFAAASDKRIANIYDFIRFDSISRRLTNWSKSTIDELGAFRYSNNLRRRWLKEVRKAIVERLNEQP